MLRTIRSLFRTPKRRMKEPFDEDGFPGESISLKKSLRDLYKIIKADPSLSTEIPKVRKLASRAFGWLLLAELLMVLQFYPIRWFMDELTKEQTSERQLLIFGAALFVISFVAVVVNKFKSTARSNTEYRIWRMWWGFGHLSELRLSMDFHKKFGTAEKESMVGKNIYKFEVMVDEFIFETVPATLRIAFAMVLMFFINWQLGLLSLVTALCFGIVMWRNERTSQPLRKEMKRELKRLERFGTEMTSNVETIKLLGEEENFGQRNFDMLGTFVENQKARTRIFSKLEARQMQVVTFSRVALFGLLALQFESAQSIGTIVLASFIMERAIYVSLQRYSNFQRAANDGAEALRELSWIMTLEPTVKQSAHPVFPDALQPSITFDNVSFAYSDEPDSAKLRDFTLDIDSFSTIAVTGPSGGGKSTMMKLLLREFDPTEGRILINGVDLRDLDYYRYRREVVSVVSQNIQLFDGTIIENIRLGRPDATDEECIEAAKMAHAHEYIREQPLGYFSEIGENGINLSGGERQRLAIARALVRNPLILVLDEATSALDPESQAIVQRTLDELSASRRMTILLVAHRYSTIVGAEHVAVLDKGEMAECGTHEELEERDGLYAKLKSMEFAPPPG